MFLIALLISTVIAFAIMQYCGHFSLVIILTLIYATWKTYEIISKKFFPEGVSFEFKYTFTLIYTGIITGTIAYCIYFFLDEIANVIFR